MLDEVAKKTFIHSIQNAMMILNRVIYSVKRRDIFKCYQPPCYLKRFSRKKMQFLVTPTEFAIARYFLIQLVVFQINFGVALLPSKTRLAKLDIRSRFVCGFVLVGSLN